MLTFRGRGLPRPPGCMWRLAAGTGLKLTPPHGQAGLHRPPSTPAFSVLQGVSPWLPNCCTPESLPGPRDQGVYPY